MLVKIKDIIEWFDYEIQKIKDYGFWYKFIQEPYDDYIETPLWKVWRIITWIPTLWNIYDFEGTDLYKVIDHQLARTQRVLQNDPHHCTEEDENILSGPIYAAEIQEARDCIKRLREDEYCKEEWEHHDKTWGEFGMKDGKVSLDKDEKPLTTEIIIIPNHEDAQEYRSKIWKLEEERKEADKEKLFRILRDRIEYWWS